MLRVQIVTAAPLVRRWHLCDPTPLFAAVARHPAGCRQLTDELHRLGSFARGDWTSIVEKALGTTPYPGHRCCRRQPLWLVRCSHQHQINQQRTNQFQSQRTCVVVSGRLHDGQPLVCTPAGETVQCTELHFIKRTRAVQLSRISYSRWASILPTSQEPFKLAAATCKVPWTGSWHSGDPLVHIHSSSSHRSSRNHHNSDHSSSDRSSNSNNNHTNNSCSSRW